MARNRSFNSPTFWPSRSTTLPRWARRGAVRRQHPRASAPCRITISATASSSTTTSSRRSANDRRSWRWHVDSRLDAQRQPHRHLRHAFHRDRLRATPREPESSAAPAPSAPDFRSTPAPATSISRAFIDPGVGDLRQRRPQHHSGHHRLHDCMRRCSGRSVSGAAQLSFQVNATNPINHVNVTGFGTVIGSSTLACHRRRRHAQHYRATRFTF